MHVFRSTLLCLLVAASASADVHFIQLTDTHLWDAEPLNGNESEGAENLRALHGAVDTINVLQARQATPYDFVIVTGDLGIEKLPDGAPFAEGVKTLADEIARARVSVWYFVPGNNDLTEEQPATIGRYRAFVAQLQTQLPRRRIVDLTGPAVAPPVIEGRCIVAVDDASFKNNDQLTNTIANAPLQLQIVAGATTRIGGCKSAYLFMHIPETDDPWGAGSGRDAFLKKRFGDAAKAAAAPFPFSSWLVDPRVRDAWHRLVVDDRVKAIFAGHYHDNHQATYEDFRWSRSALYPSATVTKTFVCPPLAVKRQKGMSEQARGFAEVVIDGDGRVTRRIFWYGAGSFAATPATADDLALDQLAHGKRLAEGGDLAAAQKAYELAAASSNREIRARAMTALQNITARQQMWYRRYALEPLRSAYVAAAPGLLPLGLLAFLVIAVKRFLGRRIGRGKMMFGTIYDIAATGQGAMLRIALEDAYRSLMLQLSPVLAPGSDGRMPLVISSESWDVAELLEIGSPAAGRALAWVSKQLRKPEYVLEGSLVPTTGGVLTVVRLLQWGNLTAEWSDTLSSKAFVRDCGDFAFRTLVDMKHHI